MCIYSVMTKKGYQIFQARKRPPPLGQSWIRHCTTCVHCTLIMYWQVYYRVRHPAPLWRFSAILAPDINATTYLLTYLLYSVTIVS